MYFYSHLFPSAQLYIGTAAAESWSSTASSRETHTEPLCSFQASIWHHIPCFWCPDCQSCAVFYIPFVVQVFYHGHVAGCLVGILYLGEHDSASHSFKCLLPCFVDWEFHIYFVLNYVYIILVIYVCVCNFFCCAKATILREIQMD